MPAYFSTECNAYGIGHKLEIPTTPEPLLFILNPDDIVYAEESGDASISIKYARNTRTINSVFKTFQITLYGLEAEVVEQISNFALTDFLTNVQTNGVGSISLYYVGELLENLYIQPPINKGPSIYKNWELPTPTEVFDQINFTLIYPDPRWF